MNINSTISVSKSPPDCILGRAHFLPGSACGQSPARVGKMPVQLWQSERHTQMCPRRPDCQKMSGGFLPKNYIGSGALSKSKCAVSPRDTGLIPKERKNPLHDNPIIFT